MQRNQVAESDETCAGPSARITRTRHLCGHVACRVLTAVARTQDGRRDLEENGFVDRWLLNEAGERRARANAEITPEQESELVRQHLAHWAVKDALRTTSTRAGSGLVRAADHRLQLER